MSQNFSRRRPGSRRDRGGIAAELPCALERVLFDTSLIERIFRAELLRVLLGKGLIC